MLIQKIPYRLKAEHVQKSLSLITLYCAIFKSSIKFAIQQKKLSP